MFGKAADALLNEPVVPEGWTVKDNPPFNGLGNAFVFSHKFYDVTSMDNEELWGFGSSRIDCIAQINVIIDEGME